MIEEFEPTKEREIKIGINSNVFLEYSLTQEETFETFEYSVKFLDVFKETGVKLVRVGASFDAWVLGNKREQEFDDLYIEELRKRGFELFLADTQHQSYLTKNPLSWNEFKKIHLERIRFYVKRYSPEYYSVVTELLIYHNFNIKDDFDVDEWVSHTQNLPNVVKEVSSKTKTIVYITADSIPKGGGEYFLKVLDMKNLDIIGIDFYSAKGFKLTDELLKISHSQEHKKELWLPETWYGLTFLCSPQWKENLDAKWIEACYNYAKSRNFDAYLPWTFGYFVTYNCEYLGEEIDFSQRTESFYTFKSLVEGKTKYLWLKEFSVMSRFTIA
ncbi:MAG: hypothetical protein ACE5K0_10675 [Candidatus Methanofastidiosia archaeon]